MKKVSKVVMMAMAIVAMVGFSVQPSKGVENQMNALPFIYNVTGTVIDVYNSDCWYVEDCITRQRHYFSRSNVPSWVNIQPGNSYRVEFMANPTSSCSFYDLSSAFSAYCP